MTTELVVLLTLLMIVIVGVFKTPTRTFDEAGPKLGMRIEKQLETGAGFTVISQSKPNPVTWGRKQ